MEMSWSTFILEIVNFLVLVWILKRFLYKPVMDVIARRRAGIEQTLAEAAEQREQAEHLQQQYDGRLADWDRERQKARDALAQELDAERSRKVAELQAILEQERDKAQQAELRRQADTLRKAEETALAQGAQFATRLLQEASGPDIETRLVEMVLAALPGLPEDRLTALRSARANATLDVVVTSAFPLADGQRERLAQAVAALVGADAKVRFEQDAALLAGLRIRIGAWVLGANLRDELQGFVELAHAD
jgi:F-type H+-transporting ATPase subunit b